MSNDSADMLHKDVVMMTFDSLIDRLNKLEVIYRNTKPKTRLFMENVDTENPLRIQAPIHLKSACVSSEGGKLYIKLKNKSPVLLCCSTKHSKFFQLDIDITKEDLASEIDIISVDYVRSCQWGLLGDRIIHD